MSIDNQTHTRLSFSLFCSVVLRRPPKSASTTQMMNSMRRVRGCGHRRWRAPTVAVAALYEYGNAVGIGGSQADNSTSSAGAVYLY